MTATPESRGPAAPETDEYEYEDDGFGESLPVRPRRPFLTKWTAAVMALVLGGAGFYVGVRVEKNDTAGSTGGASALASTFSGTGSKSAKAGSKASFAGGGFPSAGGSGTSGTVSSIKGDTIYVKESSGDTVAVKLSGATTVTKSESVSKAKVYPGDEVVITGTTGSGGTVKATAVTDSGASDSTSSSTSSSSDSTSLDVSSLFGGA